MKVLICNPDEKTAEQTQQQIREFAKQMKVSLDTYVFSSPVDVAASDIRFELAVIEVGMEDINGITLGKILTKSIPYIKLIYTASQSKDLDNSFDMQAVRYLKRPYSGERFFAGLKEAIRRVNSETVCFDFKDDDTKVRVCKDEIMYIEILSRKTKIVTKTQTYYSSHSLSYWKEHLHSTKFLVPHNSYLVNIDYIGKYRRNQYVDMKNGDRISIARGKAAAFHQQYSAYQNSML